MNRHILIVSDPLLGHVTAHVRGRMFQPLFERNGWRVEFLGRRPETDGIDAVAVARREREIVRRARRADVVYLLKVSSLDLVSRIRETSKARIVFDLSDSLWTSYHRAHGWIDLEQILASVDAVFCENRYVAAYARKRNQSVYVVPDCVPIDRFDEQRPLVHRDPSKIVIGWIGSDGTIGALGAVRDSLETVFARHPSLHLRIMGYENVSPMPEFEHVRFSVSGRYTEGEMVREVLATDIGIFPPPLDLEDYAARGPLKATIYMAGGVPVVCQDAGECSDLITDGVNGMLANSPSEWTDRLEALIRSEALRCEVGRRGLESVRDVYSPESVFRTLERALMGVIAAPQAACTERPGARLNSVHSETCLRRKRVVLVLEHLQMGGAERQVIELAKYLKEICEATVEVWGLHAHGSVSQILARSGIGCRVVPVEWTWSRLQVAMSLVRFGWELRKARPDVVLPYTRLPNIVCGLVWKWSGAKLCVWNQRDEGRELTGCRSEIRAVANTPRFISNSRHAAEMLVQRYGVQPERIAVIRNGIRTPVPRTDRAAWRKKLGVGPDDWLACMLANLHIYKDHDTLVDAWQVVVRAAARHSRRVVLVLAGRDGNRLKDLKNRAFDLGMSGRDILFPGQVDDVAGLVAACDIGVFSSRFEGVPNGLLECMAGGLPVVATDIAAIREAVSDSYPLLAPPGDANAFAHHILWLLDHPQCCIEIGAQLRHRVGTEFSVDRMGRESAQVLSEAWGS